MTLAQRQAELVAALVSSGDPPDGFDSTRLEATRRALIGKRAEEVARVWPRLAATYKGRWAEEFGRWAQGRPPQGSLWDGWDFALAHPPSDDGARVELLAREALWKRSTRKRRWLPAFRRSGRVLVIQVARRLHIAAGKSR